MKIDTENWKNEIPEPIFDQQPEFTELYWSAWELAYDHIKEVPGLPQSPYMDEAFCDTEIWIWDTCFMSLFCKYGQKVFPGVESLKNFYEVLYGNKTLPKIITHSPPEWTDYKIGEEIQLAIHLIDNPPLFAWAELCNARFHGDKNYIRELLIDKKYLQQHYEYLEQLKCAECPPFVRHESFMRKHPLGFFWEGGRSGMDNTPRGRTGPHAECDRPNNPQMLWLDAAVQQGFSAKCIAELAEYIDEPQVAEEWNAKYQSYKKLINQHYLDRRDGCYYDINAETLDFMKVMSIVSFWPLLAQMPDDTDARKLIMLLQDSNKFGGNIPLVSLARDDADFNAETGEYWHGAVWLPTAYMTIKGLEKYGYFDLARELSLKLIKHMSNTYINYEPHSIWECYNPGKPMPANGCGEVEDNVVREDFCGWSALGPIALYLENIIGIYDVDAFTNVIKWQLDTGYTGRTGVKNFHFGNIITDLIYEEGQVKVWSNHSYSLEINNQLFSIKSGENVVYLQSEPVPSF